jgi:hypothetical protein
VLERLLTNLPNAGVPELGEFAPNAPTRARLERHECREGSGGEARARAVRLLALCAWLLLPGCRGEKLNGVADAGRLPVVDAKLLDAGLPLPSCEPSLVQLLEMEDCVSTLSRSCERTEWRVVVHGALRARLTGKDGGTCLVRSDSAQAFTLLFSLRNDSALQPLEVVGAVTTAPEVEFPPVVMCGSCQSKFQDEDGQWRRVR